LKVILIAEIGNNHCGDFNKAKELVRVAIDSGATLIKGQLFLSNKFKGGSMPMDFYEQCQLKIYQYFELIEYAKELKSQMFYSIFTEDLNFFSKYQSFQKIAASQVLEGIKISDRPTTFVSIPFDKIDKLPFLKKATILHVSDYCSPDAKLDTISILANCYQRNIGYSDHSIGIDNCLKAFNIYGSKVIEKHFILEKDKNNIKFKQEIFRDSIHSATPREFELLARRTNV